ncbi:TerB family tellurite resistance protein [Pelagibacterales bacterium SAG-MED01]|nr:TerB family tellurite resistance protein [Pelagibacterales bacterium SAG-MED01]
MFFKNNKENNKVQDLDKIAALLIHAAKIDQNYSSQEEEIIKQTLLKIGANNESIKIIINNGKKIEEDSNQILEFTKEVKNMNEDNKIKIIEALWKIIYSNKDADIYETNLMRRLAGLLYIDSKIMGDIKDKIKKENL